MALKHFVCGKFFLNLFCNVCLGPPSGKQYYNLVVVCLISPVLHVILMVYKRLKNREDADIGISLRQQVITGARSPFKLAFLSVSFVVFLVFLSLHKLHSESIEVMLLLCVVL